MQQLSTGASARLSLSSERGFVERCRAVAVGVALLLSLFGCGNSTPARPQLLIEVDTDVPTLDQALADEDISLDAAVDTLRIDAIRDDGTLVDFLEVAAPSPNDWPITFGALLPEVGQGLRFHMRLFRSEHATRATIDGVCTLESSPRLTVQRVVELEMPEAGIAEVRVVLSGDCMGITSKFGKAASTCIDAARTSAPAAEGIEAMTGRSLVGSWALARAIPCEGEPPEGAVCVPGGFSMLGQEGLAGFGEFSDAGTLVPILTQPFFVDRTEITVGQYRNYFTQHPLSFNRAGSYVPGDPINQSCAFRAHDVSDYDALPLNCAQWATFRAMCQWAGGDLPTEAQWEHMARGRGQARTFPWGDEDVECCRASVSRESLPGVPLKCASARGIEAVGSHLASESCGGVGDESRDGVLDLGGSLSELTLDTPRAYTDPCWSAPGILRDPQCAEADGLITMRGGNFTAGAQVATAALRGIWNKTSWSGGVGARCIYPAGGDQ